MNDFLQAPAIEPLPSAPLLERFLFEQPLLPVIVLVLLAVVAVVAFAGRNQRTRGLILAGVLLALAGAVYLAASLVTTTRETLLERTQALIGATAEARTQTLRTLLTGDATLNTSGDIRRVLPPVEDVGELLDQVDRYLGNRPASQFTITGWATRDQQATVDGRNVARTLVRVGVDTYSFSRTHYSWWRLHWTLDDDDQWRCFEIEPRWIQFVGSADGV